MKLLVVIIVLFLSGCGNRPENKSLPVDVADSEIIHRGEIKDYPELLAVFNDLNNCMLLEFEIFNESEPPLLFIVKNNINCAGEMTSGCFSFTDNVIYLRDQEQPEMDKLTFGHELIHWITQRGNEVHDQAYFDTCLRPYGVLS